MTKAKLIVFYLAIICLIPISQAVAGVDSIDGLVSIPLPPSVLLLGSGLVGLAGWRWFRKR